MDRPVLETLRLRLEPLATRHADAVHAINGDAAVMKWIGDGEPEIAEESREFVDWAAETWARRGFSWFAFIERATGGLIGCGPLTHLEEDPGKGTKSAGASGPNAGERATPPRPPEP